jgi:hypothetical protein
MVVFPPARWFRSLFRKINNKPFVRPRWRRRERTYRPEFELLEDRTVPSNMGTIHATDSTVTIVEETHYAAKTDVYVYGNFLVGADGVHLADGFYDVEVVAPGGKSGKDADDILGLSDPNHPVEVSGGHFTGKFLDGLTTSPITGPIPPGAPSGPRGQAFNVWDEVFQTGVNGGTAGAQGYDDTDNPGGEYQVVIAQHIAGEQQDNFSQFTGNNAVTKSKNFKVNQTPTTDPTQVTTAYVLTSPSGATFGPASSGLIGPLGSTVTDTATVTDTTHATTTPTGSVDFQLSFSTDGVHYTVIEESGDVNLVGGTASYAFTITGPLAAGYYNIVASFTDGTQFSESESLQEPFKINTPPTAGATDLGCIAQGTSETTTETALLANASDSDVGDTLVITGVSNPTPNGATVTDTNGTIVYTPPAGFWGTATFTYTVSDGLDTATGTATIEVDAQPTTTPVSFTIQEGGSLSDSVASDFSSPDASETLTVVAGPITTVQGGSVTMNSDGSFKYSPPSPTFHGPDSFSYTVTDEDGCVSAPGTVSIFVNAPPVPGALDLGCKVSGSTFTTSESTLVGLASDPDNVPPGSDPLTITAVAGTSAQGGTVTDVLGVITYTPPSTTFYGDDSFTYTISDSHGGSATGTVTLELDAQPTTTPVSFTIQEGGSLSDSVASDFSSPDASETLTVVAGPITTVQGGSVTMNSDGSFKYSPPSLTFHGPDSFTYTVTDEDGCVSAPGTVSIFVNAPPVPGALDLGCKVSGSTFTTSESTLVGLASDPDGDPLTITAVAGTSGHGGKVTDTSGVITYVPPSGYFGDDSFTYTISDNHGGSATGTVTVELDAPITAASATYTTALNTSVTTAKVISDADSSESLTVSITTQPAHGTVTINGTGTDTTFTYKPNDDWHGSDSFVYYVTDEDGCVHASGTVTINTVSGALTQGYWKNHQSVFDAVLAADPNHAGFTSGGKLLIGGSLYTSSEAIALMQMSTGTGTSANALLMVWQQLVAAKLNVLNGVTPDAADLAAIADADAAIVQAAGQLSSTKLVGGKKGQLTWAANNSQAFVSVSTVLGQRMVHDNDILDAFNSTGK